MASSNPTCQPPRPPPPSSSSAPASAASPPRSSCAATALTTSRSSRPRPISAARGSTTAIRARPATCPATCTRSPTSSGATGRGCARRRRRSSATCASVARDHGVTGLDPLLRSASPTARSTRRAPLDGPRPSRATRYEADALVLATGQLNRPAIPALPGLRALRRPQLPLGALGPRLRPARQARRGGRHRAPAPCSSSPRWPSRPRRLSVFQRTGNWFLPRRNQRLPAAGARRDPLRPRPAAPAPQLPLQLLREPDAGDPPPAHDRAACPGLRSAAFMRRQLPDPELRRRAWPDYTFGCKRVLFSSHYLPALSRPNVELVTDTDQPRSPRPACAPATDACTRSTASSGARASRPPSSWLPMRVAGAGGRDAGRRVERRRARPPGPDRARLPVDVPHLRPQHQHLGRVDHLLPRGPGRLHPPGAASTCAPAATAASTCGPRWRRRQTASCRPGSRAPRGRGATPGTATSRADRHQLARLHARVPGAHPDLRALRVRLQLVARQAPGARSPCGVLAWYRRTSTADLENGDLAKPRRLQGFLVDNHCQTVVIYQHPRAGHTEAPIPAKPVTRKPVVERGHVPPRHGTPHPDATPHGHYAGASIAWGLTASSRSTLASAGNRRPQLTAMSIVMTPPPTTAGIVPTRAAARPDSK